MRRRWELMTSDEIRDTVAPGMDLALFPVGAAEQHGPHLATSTDTMSPQEIVWRVSDATGAVVLPALPYGLSLCHTTHWPGTLSLHPPTMSQVIVEIGRWVVASGFKRLIFLSGNGPNAPPLENARRALADDGKALVELLVDELSKIVASALVEQWPAPPGPS